MTKVATVFFASFLFFGGCASQTPNVSKTVFVSINAHKIKFADMGFLDEFENKKSLEVYALGSPVFKISFDDFVCIDSGCMEKAEFVKEYISKALYGDLMNDVLSKKPLKVESTIIKSENGFIQEIKTDDYDILYRTDEREIYFYEKISGFKFVARFVD